MTPENVRTAADASKIVEERKLDHVKVGVFDNDGIMRGKYMGRDKFFSALDKGFGFCDVVLGWDSNDQLYDNVKYTGWHTAYPDAPVRVLPETCRSVPFEGDMVMFLGEFAEKAEAVCPRATLRRVLEKADDLGYGVNAATEFEFFMFKETPESVRAKGFRDLTTMTPGFFGYSVLRSSSVHSEFYHQLMKMCTEHADARSKACTPRPGRACSKRPSSIARRSKPRTAARCSRRSRRSSRSATA